MSQKHFPNQRKQAVTVPVYTKGNNAYVLNMRPKSLLRNFSKVFELLCITSCLIIANINLMLVSIVLFKIHIYYYKTYYRI